VSPELHNLEPAPCRLDQQTSNRKVAASVSRGELGPGTVLDLVCGGSVTTAGSLVIVEVGQI
jgi:hypothetical protein